VRGVRLRGPAGGHGAAAARRRRRGAGRHHVTFGAPTTPAVVVGTPPAGDLHFRHPGDVVRLILWATATAVVALTIWLGRSTSEGLTVDLVRAAGGVP